MIWGGITFNAKTPLYIVQGNLTANAYINQIVDQYFRPFLNANPGIIFQQEGARPNTVRATINHLNSHNVSILPLPSKSADLNLIEHIWNELDKRLKKRAKRQALQEEWQRFPQYKIRLVSSKRRRCQACIAARGGRTQY